MSAASSFARGPALVLVAGLLAFLTTPSCSIATSIDDRPCPPGGTTLTYENFGAGFFAVNCNYCHGGPDGYSSRAFTTVDSIRAERDRIFLNAAADNRSMPPGPDGPPSSEREKLAEWLSCGAP